MHSVAVPVTEKKNYTSREDWFTVQPDSFQRKLCEWNRRKTFYQIAMTSDILILYLIHSSDRF